MNELSLAAQAHQATLEHLRTARHQDAPDEVVEQLEGDERRARRELEVAWLDRQLQA